MQDYVKKLKKLNIHENTNTTAMKGNCTVIIIIVRLFLTRRNMTKTLQGLQSLNNYENSSQGQRTKSDITNFQSPLVFTSVT